MNPETHEAWVEKVLAEAERDAEEESRAQAAACPADDPGDADTPE
jgi:hypothetical protein